MGRGGRKDGREPDPRRYQHERGPFDLIGDVHGCAAELRELLALLGYVAGEDGVHRHPGGRKAVFVGDLVDRGPDIPDALRLVLGMVEAGVAYCAPGNHDDKYARLLAGRQVKVSHGLEDTVEQVRALPGKEGSHLEARFRRWFQAMPWHLVLDGGNLVVAHAGIDARLVGQTGHRVRSRALYGEVLGFEASGLPIRRDWAADYAGKAFVAYGHTPTLPARVVNNTANIDQGCVFGGYLTGLRYPEMEFVSVPSRGAWADTTEAFAVALRAAGREPLGVK
ncbi:MAG TPA: metallophosphoesterase [Deinococcales bacterium]|nr:metallophosphoesterase [Deinococcales bacterium]